MYLHVIISNVTFGRRNWNFNLTWWIQIKQPVQMSYESKWIDVLCKFWICFNTCAISIILEYPYLENVTVNHFDMEHFFCFINDEMISCDNRHGNRYEVLLSIKKSVWPTFLLRFLVKYTVQAVNIRSLQLKVYGSDGWKYTVLGLVIHGPLL